MATMSTHLSSWHLHFMRLARYNVWATRRLLAAVETVPEADYRRDVGLFFKSLHGTLNHLRVGEQLVWLPRFRGEAVVFAQMQPPLRLDSEVEIDRQRLALVLQDGTQAWEPLIASWPDAQFDGDLAYTTTAGVPQVLPFAATLTHVFNHSTHHRGQITAALTALGHACPELDLVYFLREESL